MKFLKLTSAIILLLIFNACGGDSNKKETPEIRLVTNTTPKASETPSATELVDLENKGIGPISSITIGNDIDAAMAQHGKEVFNNLCVACHHIDRRFIGPKMEGVTKRRAPEWIMNMILNPIEMIEKDPIAKQLLVEYNNAIMIDQNMSKEDTRALLEYFRQIDAN